MSSWAAVPVDEKSPGLVLPTKTEPIPVSTGGTPKTDSWRAVPLDLIKGGIPRADSNIHYKPGESPSPEATVLRYANKLTPVIGGTIGGATGGPVGMAAGSGVGSVIGENIDSFLADKEYPSLKDNAINFGKSAALAGIGGAVAGEAADAFPGKYQSKLASVIANTVVGQSARAGEAALGSGGEGSTPGTAAKDFGTNAALDLVLGKVVDAGIKRTAAGRSEIPTETTLPQAVGSERYRVKLGGEGPLPEDAENTPGRSKYEFGKEAQTVLRSNIGTARALEKNAYDNFNANHVNNNVVTLDQFGGMKESSVLDPKTGKPISTPIINKVDVRGPIYTTESTLKAAQFKPTIDGLIKGPEFEALPPYQQARLRQLNQLVDKLTTGTPTIQGGQPVNVPILEFNTAKQIKSYISQKFSGTVNKTLQDGGMGELAKTLDKDIDTSIQKWNNGKQAASDLETAHQATIYNKNTFNAEIKKRLYGIGDNGKQDTRTTADPEEVFNDAFRTKEGVQKLKAALGSENEGLVRENYFDNYLLPKAFGKSNESFNPRAVINEFENPNSVSREVFTANQRNGISQFMKAVEASSPDNSGGGLSLKGRLVSIGAGQIAGLSGVPGARNTIRFGTEAMIKAFADNPQAANYATRLVKILSNSTQGQQLTRLLMKSMRGAEVTLVTDNGERKGTVTENGLIKF